MSAQPNLDLGPGDRWDLQLPALTIKEPWLEMILIGLKRAEFRSWKLPAAKVGHTVVLCAGKSVDTKAMDLIRKRKGNEAAEELLERTRERLGHARALCVFRATASPTATAYEYTPGNPGCGWAWPIQVVVRLAHPFRVRGSQRFFTLRATYRQLYPDITTVNTYQGLGVDHARGFVNMIRGACAVSPSRGEGW